MVPSQKLTPGQLLQESSDSPMPTAIVVAVLYDASPDPATEAREAVITNPMVIHAIPIGLIQWLADELVEANCEKAIDNGMNFNGVGGPEAER